MAKVISDPLVQALRDAGIADDNTRRVVIDIQVGCLPLVHIERYGDDRLLSVVRGLSGVEIKREEGGQ